MNEQRRLLLLLQLGRFPLGPAGLGKPPPKSLGAPLCSAETGGLSRTGRIWMAGLPVCPAGGMEADGFWSVPEGRAGVSVQSSFRETALYGNIILKKGTLVLAPL